MSNPQVLGRTDDGCVDPRASTTCVHTLSVPFEGGAVGVVYVSVYRSVDDEDRGGLVLKVCIEDKASSFQPHAVNVANGVELHVAGDIEAKSVVRALATALATLSEVGRGA